jgi:hypothetical protein
VRIRLCVSVRVHAFSRSQLTGHSHRSILQSQSRSTFTVYCHGHCHCHNLCPSEVATCRSARVPVGGGAATLPDALHALTMLYSVCIISDVVAGWRPHKQS